MSNCSAWHAYSMTNASKHAMQPPPQLSGQEALEMERLKVGVSIIWDAKYRNAHEQVHAPGIFRKLPLGVRRARATDPVKQSFLPFTTMHAQVQRMQIELQQQQLALQQQQAAVAAQSQMPMMAPHPQAATTAVVVSAPVAQQYTTTTTYSQGQT